MNELLIETKEGVRTLTLNRPERLNAINDALTNQIEEALAHASVDDEVRVVVITGNGRAFCTGLDLTAVPSFDTRHEQLDDLGWVGRQALGIVQCDKPVIAAVNGVAAGAGFSLALACDLCFMSENAIVKTGYIHRGLSPDAGMSYFLPRLVGHARATELIFTGRDVDAEEAKQIGLISGIHKHKNFHDLIFTFAKDLAQGPPVALTLAKRLLNSSPESDLSSILKQEYAAIKTCFSTDDVGEGVQAFLEKRKPIFKGK